MMPKTLPGELVEQNLQTGQETVLYSATESELDLTEYFDTGLVLGFHPTEGRQVFVMEYYDKPKLVSLEPRYETDFDYLRGLVRDEGGFIGAVQFSDGS